MVIALLIILIAEQGIIYYRTKHMLHFYHPMDNQSNFVFTLNRQKVVMEIKNKLNVSAHQMP